MHRSVPFNELTALYSVADVCLLTSTRDGMNLVAFEYVACQEERHGVLVLSEFAGAASFMTNGSIPFHPANKTEMSEAIFNALNLDPAERKAKYEYLRGFVNANTRFERLSWFIIVSLLTFAVQNGARPSSKNYPCVVDDPGSHVDR